MTPPAALSIAPPSAASAGLIADVRRAFGRVTWRVVGVTLAIAAALDLWTIVEGTLQRGPRLPAPEAYGSATVINVAMSFAIMLATLVADERVAKGARRVLAYGTAVVIGSAAGALTQWQAHQWLELRWHSDLPAVPQAVTIMQPAFVFFEYLIWGSIIVFIYVSRCSALNATARMNAAHMERSAAQRRTSESRLQMLQARIEPQFLLTTLSQVHELYESDTAKASRLLGDLIVYLRAALPNLRESTSTLGQELDLARAYLDIANVRGNERLLVAIDASGNIRAARMPSMVLLPLISRAITDVFAACRTPDDSIRIEARRTMDRLRVEIACGGTGSFAHVERAGVTDIRERLAILYGSSATLALDASRSRDLRLAIEIPLEFADGNHR